MSEYARQADDVDVRLTTFRSHATTQSMTGYDDEHDDHLACVHKMDI